LKSLTQSGQAVNFLKDNLKNPVALDQNKPVKAIKTA
jgi:hypothetical protein